jgi:hypothetical protein
MKTYGGIEANLHAFLTSALDGGEWSASHSGHLSLLDTRLWLAGHRAVSWSLLYFRGVTEEEDEGQRTEMWIL